MPRQAKLSIFDTAQSFGKKPAARKAKTVEVPIEGLEDLAAFDKVLKEMETISAVLEGEVKTRVAKTFLDEGGAIKRRPENFKGYENLGSGSCQLRLRSSRSALNEIEAEFLKDNGIETEVIEDVPETFIINPKYASDPVILGKLAKALETVKLPEDVILKQDGVSKRVVTENGLGQVFAKARDLAEKLLPITGVIALRLKWNGTVKEAFEKVQASVNDDESE